MKNEFNDPRIDDALTSYPVAQLPEDFIANTIAQIEPRTNENYWSRLRFVDIAVPVFFALFIGGTTYFVWNLSQNPNSLWLLHLKTELALLAGAVPPLNINAPLLYGGMLLLGFFSLISYIIYSEQSSRIY